MAGERRNPGRAATNTALDPDGSRAAAATPVARSSARKVTTAPGRQPSEDELVAAMDGCAGYLAGVEPISRRVIVTAHIGGFTDESVDRATEIAVDNILVVLCKNAESGTDPETIQEGTAEEQQR